MAETLTATQRGFQHTRAAKYRGWDGRVSFFNRTTKATPTGLVLRAVRALDYAGFKSKLSLRYERPAAPPLRPELVLPEGREVRGYQQKAAETACRVGRIALQVGTGGGKTLIGAEIIRRMGLPSLWMVHTKDLLYQVQEGLQAMLGRPVGIVGDGRVEIPAGPVPIVVGMVQSLVRLPESAPLWRVFRLLIIDECQFASAETWYEVALRLEAAIYRVALSGTVQTPCPARNMRLEGMTGPLVVVEGASEGELIESGFLARPTIWLLRAPEYTFPTKVEVRDAVCPDWREKPKKLMKYGAKMFKEAYHRGIMTNPRRDKLFMAQSANALKLGERVMLMCQRLEHGKRVFDLAAERFPGVPLWWLSGEETAERRGQTVKDYQKTSGGALLIVSKIFDAGRDIPEIDNLGLMGGGESSNTTFQRVGRALRKNKDTVNIWDSIDGITPRERKDYLAQHTVKRIGDYLSKGYQVRFAEGGLRDDFTALLSAQFGL